MKTLVQLEPLRVSLYTWSPTWANNACEFGVKTNFE